MSDRVYENGELEILGGGYHGRDCQGETQPGGCWCGARQYATPTIVLPHQCDEWVIGQPKDAELLIADLQLACSRIRAT